MAKATVKKTEQNNVTVTADKRVLKPVLTPSTTSVSTVSVSPGQCIVGTTDAKGQVHEFVTSTRMWDRVYSKRENFTLKKK